MNYIYIGPVPCNETCSDRPTRYYNQMRTFREQIRRVFGEEPKGARLVIRSFNGGEYSDLVCEYEEGNKPAYEYALAVEGNTPAHWDLWSLVALTAGEVPIPGDSAWINIYRIQEEECNA